MSPMSPHFTHLARLKFEEKKYRVMCLFEQELAEAKANPADLMAHRMAKWVCLLEGSFRGLF